MTDCKETRWAELEVTDDGLSFTLYEEDSPDHPGVHVVDEGWLTDDEIQAARDRDEQSALIVLSE